MDRSAVGAGVSKLGLRQAAGDRAAAGTGAHSRGRRPGTIFCGIECLDDLNMIHDQMSEITLEYRMTIPLVQNLPLISKQKFRFGLACPGVARP